VQVVYRGEAAGSVKLERCGVGRFCLDGQADGADLRSGRNNGRDQRPPGTAAPCPGHDIKIAKLPGAGQPQGRRHDHSGGDAHQVPVDVGGENASMPERVYWVSQARVWPATTGWP